jgi:hypothetical protein
VGLLANDETRGICDEPPVQADDRRACSDGKDCRSLKCRLTGIPLNGGGSRKEAVSREAIETGSPHARTPSLFRREAAVLIGSYGSSRRSVW